MKLASWRPFALGVLATLAAEVAVAGLVVWSGVVDVAATKRREIPDRILGYASTRAIARHASKEENPLRGDPVALKAGLEEYREACVACHGGPGREREEFALGLHPPAPDLASPEIQAFTDGMLYSTVAGGIGSTGMPAFGSTHDPRELWSLVAFVRHLPGLTPEEQRELAATPAAAPRDGAAAAPGGEVGGEGAAAAPSGGVARVHQVSISGFRFMPATLEVQAGDAIEWKNADVVAHTATAQDGSFDTGRIEPGAAKRVVARAKGRFAYLCRYHPSMKGTLVVQ